MKPLALAVFFAASLATLQGQQQAPAAIHGRVVADDTGDPIPHARVVLWDDATPREPLFTAVDGSFTSEPLPIKRRRFVFSKAGYASADVSPLVDDAANGLNIRLRRSGAISGRVVDARGDPVSEMRVYVLEMRAELPFGFPKLTLTNDRGEYRVGSLAEGRYVVRAGVPDGFVYYPSTRTVDDARRVAISPGDEKNGIDVVLDGARLPSAVLTTAPLVILNNGRLQAGNASLISTSTGTTEIRGRVLDRVGSSLPDATVILIDLDNARLSRMGTSGDTGTFAFENLVAGRYRLSALKGGYLPSDAGNRAADAGVRVDVGAGNVRRQVDLVLSRPTAITGQVLDEFGDPVEGASVGALRVQYEAGRRILESADEGSTDDRGAYRLWRLPPGRYLISAAAGRVTQFQPRGELPGYALTYFPSTPNPSEAGRVTLGPSTDTTDMTVTLVRTPTARIVGRALASNGENIGGGLKLNISHRSGAVWVPTSGAERQRDGSFVFPNVPPGEYVIQADRGRVSPSTEGEFVAQYVTVAGSDVVGVDMRATVGSTIRGRVTFDATSAPPAGGFAIVPVSADYDLCPRQNGSIARADVQPDLTFEIRGVHGPRRIQLGERTPDGWVVKAVFANGVDVTDRALPFGEPSQSLSDVELVLTDKLTELTGTIAAAQGVTRESTLLVFPIDRARWYPGSRFFHRERAAESGAFSIRGLPPGDYHVAALANPNVPADGDEAWQDSQFLESIAGRASRATLNEGQKLSIDVRLIAP
ncbi:MAG TPA: carboxypeptidase-like regulatory domain-containing protein [Vicinamibacterales bacterium]|nr:carboxypeptidase-like regulatory domain-containing protein [Vicinamibacterales bacterium]